MTRRCSTTCCVIMALRSDLLALTAEIVDINSASFDEATLVAWLGDRLDQAGWLSVDRVGDNLVARTKLGRASRIILAGHTDTVPANNNSGARLDGDRLFGLGATDMKGGLGVMLALARSQREPSSDVTYVFYAREEVASEHNGLRELFAQRPDLLAGDVAVLGDRKSVV